MSYTPLSCVTDWTNLKYNDFSGLVCDTTLCCRYPEVEESRFLQNNGTHAPGTQCHILGAIKPIYYCEEHRCEIWMHRFLTFIIRHIESMNIAQKKEQ
jgi:hypothetical protein